MSFRFSILLVSVALLSVAPPEIAHSQQQKALQKSGPGRPESDDEPEGGYQQPPGTGARQGPQRTIGIGGGEIEIPALTLKLPRLKLPCLSYFHTPPQMLVDAAVAPLVNELRREMSFESGEPESGPGEPESSDEPQQKSNYPKPYQHSDMPANYVGDDVASQVQAFQEREQILTARIELLQQSVERLLVGIESQSSRQNQTRVLPSELKPLPHVPQNPVRPTAFSEPILRGQSPRFDRLPPVR